LEDETNHYTGAINSNGYALDRIRRIMARYNHLASFLKVLSGVETGCKILESENHIDFGKATYQQAIIGWLHGGSQIRNLRPGKVFLPGIP